jgi:predicted Zn-dependent protease
MTFREIADTVLAASTSDETEVVCIRQDESLTRFANNHIHQNVTETNYEITIRCVAGTRVGTAVSNDTRAESLRSLVQRAGELANLQPENPEFKGLPGPAAVELSTHAFDSQAASCTPAHRAAGVGVACRKASALGYTAAGSMTTGAMTISVANSKGVFVEFESTLADASTVIMNGNASGWSQASGWKLDAVDWEQLSNEALEKVRIGQKTVDVAPAEMTVILDPFATSDLLGMLAYDGMSGLAYQEERSWMNGRSGQKLMSSEVTIFDDGNDLRGIPLPFDFEGQPKRRVAMVEKGICANPVYDTHTASRRPGLKSTGHAMPPSAGGATGPLPLNLFLNPGTSKVEDMIRSTKLGLYITRFWYTRPVHPRDVVVTGMTRDGTFLVQDGEIVGATKSMRFTQSYLEALAGVAAIGSQLRVQKSGGTTISVPAIKLDRFRFTSVTR